MLNIEKINKIIEKANSAKYKIEERIKELDYTTEIFEARNEFLDEERYVIVLTVNFNQWNYCGHSLTVAVWITVTDKLQLEVDIDAPEIVEDYVIKNLTENL